MEHWYKVWAKLNPLLYMNEGLDSVDGSPLIKLLISISSTPLLFVGNMIQSVIRS